MLIKPPSMAEINKSKKKFKAMSFFSGCGGSCTGHKMAGFDVIAANEFVDVARECYSLNHPSSVAIASDIRKIDPKKLLKHFGLKPGDLDLLDGSPPCKGFSSAGVQEDGWGKEVKYSEDKVQQVDDLFDEYIRQISIIKPKVFVAENVSGLVRGASKGYFVEIFNAFKSLGYKVRAPMLNAAWMGVPQARERIIFMAVRNDIPFDVPDIVPYSTIATLGEALPHIAKFKSTKNDIIVYKPACGAPFPTVTVADAIAYETARFSSAGFVETFKGERRKLTIDELKVVCGFPADYQLIGTFEQQWERLGRAVPPVMMARVSSTLASEVLEPYYKLKKKAKAKSVKPKTRSKAKA